ncbi:MAG: hypothetical protein WCP29_08395 [Acidobacteriota bacterium]
MNAPGLVVHLMWVDIKAHRALLAVWAIVLLVQTALFVQGPGDSGRFVSSVSYDIGIAIVRFGWTIVVTALLIQSDSLLGTTAFWRTRPIPRAALLTAKLLSASLWFVAAPVVVVGAMLLRLGMRPFDAATGGGLVGVEQAVIVSMTVMAALVTVNLGQLVVAGIAGVTVVAVFNGLLLPVVALAWPAVGSSLSGGQPTVYAIAVVGGGLVVATYHYLTLRSWHSVALATAAMFLATALTRLWPAAPVVPPIGPVPESVLPTSAISLATSPLAPRVDDVARATGARRSVSKRVSVELTSTGHPPGIYFWPVMATTTMNFVAPGALLWVGPSVLTPGERASRDDSEGQPWRSIHAALGDVDLDSPRRWIYFTSVAELPDDVFRARGIPAQFKTDLTMVAYRYEVTAVVPLKANAAFSAPGLASRIVSVVVVNAGARIELHETILEGALPLGHSGFGASWYVLRNNARHQAVLMMWRDFKRFSATVGIAATGVATTRRVMEVDMPPEFARRITIDAAWLDQAELVLVEPRPLGLLTRSLTIDNAARNGTAGRLSPAAMSAPLSSPDAPGSHRPPVSDGGSSTPPAGGVR